MATMAGKNPDFSKMMESMMELEYDAIAAYKAAIDRLENNTYKTKLEEFVHDHEQHLSGLKDFALGLNMNIKNVDGPDAKVIMTKGKVIFADLLGDEAILQAMKTNEDDTVSAYEQACEHENLPGNVKTLMQKGLSDETRHRAWMMQQIEQSNRKAA